MPDPAVMHGVLRHFGRTERRRLYLLLGDRELLSRFLADRDETAFEELVTRHGPMVRAVCRRVLGPSADADDAFQAAFLVLLRRARSIRKADLLAGWLCAVAYRTARQALRRRSLRVARERHMADLPEPARSDDPPRDWLPLFDAALQRLPAKYRDPVVLCELQGVSRRDASVRLGLTEGTLSSRLGRARDLLRRKLAPAGFPLAIGSALAPAVVPEALTAATVAASAHLSAASVSAVVLTEGVLVAMFASKLKAGALAGSAVLVLGVVAGLQFTGPVSGAGGPPAKDGFPAKETPKEAARVAPPKIDPKPARLAAEYEPFQGEWVIAKADAGGTTGADTLGIDERWKFTGPELTTGGELKEDSPEPFSVDATAKPATISFALLKFDPSGSGALVKTTYQGIYRFEPDGQLTIAYRRTGDGVLRPKRFATAPGAGVTILALRRPVPKPSVDLSVNYDIPVRPMAADFVLPPKADAGPPKADPAREADLGKVIGAWELTSVDGQPPDAVAAKLDTRPHPAGGPRSKQRWQALRRLQLLPATGPADLVNQSGSQSYVAYVDLDAARSPKWFTLHATERSTPAGPETPAVTITLRLCGIYKLESEKLVVCLPEEQGSPLLRPTDFAGDGEGGVYLLTYQRAAKNWKPEMRTAPKPASEPPLAADSPAAPPRIDVPMPELRQPAVAFPDVSAAPGMGPSVGGPPPTIGTPNLPLAPVGGVPPPTIDPSPSPIGPAAPSPAPETKSEAPASDLDRMQGAWVSAQGPPGERAETIEFLKDRLLGVKGHGRVRLDETKSPRQITIATGDEAPRTGIYKLEGDRLTIATSARSSKLVPLGFEADPEEEIRVTVYERPKPPSSSAATTPRADPPSKGPPRDLQKEIDQLREQLKRLEMELKDRKPVEPIVPDHRG